MLLKLTGGRIFDPAHDMNDVVRDIYIRDGRIVEKPVDGRIDQEIDVTGKVIMLERLICTRILVAVK